MQTQTIVFTIVLFIGMVALAMSYVVFYNRLNMGKKIGFGVVMHIISVLCAICTAIYPTTGITFTLWGLVILVLNIIMVSKIPE